MNYSLDEFERLAQAVDFQGGALLPETCKPQNIEFRVSDGYIRNRTEKKVTQGCGHESMFVSTYDPGKDSSDTAGFVRACAVCDGMGAWPRYAHVLDEPEEEDDGED